MTAVFENRGEWIVAYLKEIPGVNTQGRTMEEARENLADALNELMEANRELARKGIPGGIEVTEETFAILERAA